MMATTLTCFIIAAYSPLAVWLITPLENAYPEIRHLNIPPDGIIVLGGAVMPHLSEGRAHVQMGETGERMIEGLRLAKLYPQAKLVFSGGSGVIFGNQVTEAALAEKFFLEHGVPKSQLTMENKSRNTQENADLTLAIMQPKPSENWLLVTSANHMPRAMGYFKRVNFVVTPYPVDYQTRKDGKDQWAIFKNNMRLLDIAMHEYYGLAIAYVN